MIRGKQRGIGKGRGKGKGKGEGRGKVRGKGKEKGRGKGKGRGEEGDLLLTYLLQGRRVRIRLHIECFVPVLQPINYSSYSFSILKHEP